MTVYRTLDVLAELGIICKVRVGSSHSYVIGPLEHHGHLICSECGKVIDFGDCNLGELERRLSAETGFQIESHLLEFLGRCAGCQTGTMA